MDEQIETTETTQPPAAAADLSKLVSVYNKLVTSKIGQELGRFKTISSFPDEETARATIKLIQSAITARRDGLAASERKQPKKEKKVAKKSKPKVAKKAKPKVAKKAKPKVAKKAKPKVAKKAKAKAGKNGAKKRTSNGQHLAPEGSIACEFGIRAGGPREKMITMLGKNKRKMLPLNKLASAAGIENSVASFNLAKFKMKIKNHKLPYVLKSENGSHGLYPK